MSNGDQHIQRLIELKSQRLQVLEEQEAIYGIQVPPHITLEIEDLRQEILQLRGKGNAQQRSESLIDIKRRRLYELEKRAATLGSDTPPEILIEIEDINREIEQLEKRVPLENIPSRQSTIRVQSTDAVRNQIFISYSHKDLRWLQRLQVHLKPLERLGTITRWDDTLIDPGKKWQDEIKAALSVSKVAVLLVSADFLASDFIITNELPPLLASAESAGAVILSVIVSSCRFSQTETLSQFQAVNSPSQPLNLLPKGRQEAVLVRVSEAIERALKF